MHPRLDCFHAVPVLAITIVPNWHLFKFIEFYMYVSSGKNKQGQGRHFKNCFKGGILLVCKHGEVLLQ